MPDRINVQNNPVNWFDPYGLEKILTVHSNVNMSADFAEGHAWVSYNDTDTGAYQTFGLWPDTHKKIEGLGIDNGCESDVRSNIEKNYRSVFTKKYVLTEDQFYLLGMYLDAHADWRHLYNCSSWVSDLIEYVVNEKLSASDPRVGVDTPRGISNSIINSNRRKLWQ